jgi:hypothetical protein
MSDDGRDLARLLAVVEQQAVADGAPTEALDVISAMAGGTLAEAGLDPADFDQRRARALGYIAGANGWGGDPVLAVPGILRPPVVVK